MRATYRLCAIAGLITLLPGLLAGQGTSLTLFQDGRVLVRRTIASPVAAGTSIHRLALGMLDPATLFSVDSTVNVLAAVYDAALDERNTMRRMIGRSILFTRGYFRPNQPDTIRAAVLRVDPEQFRLPDGTVTFQRPGTPLYPDDAIQQSETTEVTLESRGPRRVLDLGYLSSGARWSTAYTIVLDGRRARILGNAAIVSESLWADSAGVQLLSGNIGSVGIAGGRAQFRLEAVDQVSGYSVADSVTQESIGDVHLYSLPGRHTIRSGVTATIPLFEPALAEYDKTYTVPGFIPYRGVLQQMGDENVIPVRVTYTLQRAERSSFGKLPLPGGAARVYQRDSEGRVQLIGETAIRHSAPGQDLRLTTGEAFDLTARRTETSYRTVREANRFTAFASYRVTVANGGDSTSTVDVIERRAGDWEVLSSSVRAEKLSSTETRFRLRVPAGQEAVVTYEVRVTW